MKCNCCGTMIDGQLCDYCGFINASFVDRETAKSNDRRASEHRDSLLSELESFSVSAYSFLWSESKGSFKSTGHRDLFADAHTDGRACYEKPVFSKEWIAHFEGEEKIDIRYKYGGVDKTLSSKVKIKPNTGIWHIGLHINDSLRLEILLGVEPVGSGKIEKTYVLDTIDLDFSA